MSSIELDKVIDTAKDILKKAHEENKLQSVLCLLLGVHMY